MSTEKLPEVWMRGPLPGITTLLQPVAHALLQAREEVGQLMLHFPDELLWNKIAGMASPAFHLQHMTGVLNRLFTYADNRALTEAQLQYLSDEGKFSAEISSAQLVSTFGKAVEDTVSRLRDIDENILTDFRGVGRKQLPSTVIGLLVHAAEHTMRHTGQLLITVKVLTYGTGNPDGFKADL